MVTGGEYYVEKFRQTNIKHIRMKSVCGGKNCGQGGHINANTWEMLHRIAELTGLGLVEAKGLCDNGGNIKENISADEANEIKAKLEEAGAKVELK